MSIIIKQLQGMLKLARNTSGTWVGIDESILKYVFEVRFELCKVHAHTLKYVHVLLLPLFLSHQQPKSGTSLLKHEKYPA